MTEAFLQEFEAREETDTLGTVDWLEPIRRTAMERFTRSGFPSTRDEEWRFTPVTPIAQRTWSPVTGSPKLTRQELQPFIFGHAEWTTLIFVNGVYAPALSSIGVLERGLRVTNLAEALRSDRSVLQPHLARYASVESSPLRTRAVAAADHNAAS